MNPVKIIFFDIDGTLLDHATGQISARHRAALKQLQENGVLICLATGRSPVAFPDLGDIHFDAYCAFNGSLCYTDDLVIYSNPIPQKSVAKIVENAVRIGRPVSLALRDRLAANGWDEDLGDYYTLANLRLTAADDFDAACRETVYQIMLGCRKSDHEAILSGTEGIRIAVAWDRAADVIPASSGKGTAITKILAHFNLDPSQSMAFGDGYNDAEMLQTVGTGVAMGNAPDALKAIADDVCGCVSEDGIYTYCLQHGLI